MTAPPPLSGCSIYLHGSIPMLQRRLHIIQPRLQQLGAHVCLDLPPSILNAAAVGAATTASTAAATTKGPGETAKAVAHSPASGIHPQQPHQQQPDQRQQQQQQLGPAPRHAKRKAASVLAASGAHVPRDSTAAAAAAAAGSASGGASRLSSGSKRARAAAAAAAVTPTGTGQCDSLTHVVLQLPQPEQQQHGPSPWYSSTAGSSSGGGAGSDGSDGSDGGSSSSGSGGGRRSGKADAASANKNMQLLLNQLQAYHHHRQQRGEPRQQVQLVSAGWLEAVLATGRRVPEAPYSLNHLLHPQQQQYQQQRGSVRLATAAAAPAGPLGHDSDEDSEQEGCTAAAAAAAAGAARVLRRLPDLTNLPDAPLGRLAPWLGYWTPELNSITSQVELVLHGRYSHVQEAPPGSNAAVRNALKELEGYEMAVGGGFVRRSQKDSSDPPPVNHEALTYAHAAAAVRACAFPLNAKMSPALLQQLLPFCGVFTANTIHQLLATGTCDQLQRYRANRPVLNSRGEVRPNTAGGRARALFVGLPGVGQVQALTWFEAGCSSIQDVLNLVQPAAGPATDAAGPATHAAPPPAAGAGPAAAGPATHAAGPAAAGSAIQTAEQAAAGPPANAAAGHSPAVPAGQAAPGALPNLLSGLEAHSTQGFVLGTPADAYAAVPVAAAGVGAGPGQPVMGPGIAAAAAAGRGGTPTGPGVQMNISREALYSLQHSTDLLEAVPDADVQEMGGVVLQGLAQVSGAAQEEWRMELVGGGRRRRSVHDADFLVSHPTLDLEGLVLQLYTWLVSRGRLVSREQGGFVRLQQGRMVGYKTRARNDILDKQWSNKQQMDAYDHIWGIFITAACRRRRCDVMLVPPAMWPFALLGWSGSKQYLRFLRQHAGNCGMNLNSHGLFRAVEVRARPSAEPKPVAAAAGGGGSSGGGGSAGGQAGASSVAALQFPSGGGSRSSSGAATAGVGGAASSSAAAAGDGTTGGGSGRGGPAGTSNNSSSSSSCLSCSLAETVGYVRASVVAGKSRVVLCVAEEAPPVDRDHRERWPPGWLAADAASSCVPAAGQQQQQEQAGAVAGAGAELQQQRAALAGLVCAGRGSDRGVVSERDIFLLLGVPYRDPSERCC